MREVITPYARHQIAERVKLARRLYRDAERAEREIASILQPSNGGEAVNVDDAIASCTGNEMNSVAVMLRSVGVKVSRR